MLLVERWILAALRHHEFFCLHELNEAIAKLLVSLNERLFQGRTESRRSLFNTLDSPALKALPDTVYEYAVWRHAKLAPDYHVQFDGCYFSVPHSLVGQQLDLRATDKVVEVLCRGRRVASHQRDTAKRYHTEADHMPSSHRRHAEWSPARFVKWAEDIGVATTQVVKHLLENRPHPEHGYRSCLGILTMTKHYGKPRVEAACARALAAGSMTSASVRSILKQGLDQIPIVEPECQQELPLHENLRGAKCFT